MKHLTNVRNTLHKRGKSSKKKFRYENNITTPQLIYFVIIQRQQIVYENVIIEVLDYSIATILSRSVS